MLETFDLIVIGGGRAANLAIPAAKAGLKTALIERDLLGGACPNRGCVPSKLLIGFAEAARHVRHASRHFLDAEFRGADVQRIFDSVNSYVGGVDARYQGRVDQAGVTLLRGDGRFLGPKIIEVAGRELTADKIVVATGSRPTPPPFSDLPVWTSDSLFPLASAPPKGLLVIGGGFIGCEMAAFFSAVGTQTQLFARGDRLLNREDGDIERVFQTEFSKEVTTHCHADLKDLAWDGSEFAATFDIHGERLTFHAARILFAIGRVPNTDMLDLGKTGLSADARGFLPVNDHLETAVPGIFATGDVNGRFMLQHAASFEVHYLRQKLLKGTTDPIDERFVAHAVFSYPEVASIGFTEEQLKATKTPYVAVFEDWLASARADAMRIDYPRIKLLVSPGDYSILGCHLVGPESSTLLHQVMMLMRLKNDVRELANMIYIHPALNECLLAAAVKAVGEVRRFQSRNQHP
ncbi:MAG: dihydrolipoyl dehydrogenase family protein [Verrucomicrobiales bacterium]